MKEIWRQYKNTIYEVSSLGNVRTMPRRTRNGRVIEPGRMIKNQLRKNGMYYVGMVLDGTKTTRAVHKVVAEVFLKRPEGATTVMSNNCWLELFKQ